MRKLRQHLSFFHGNVCIYADDCIKLANKKWPPIYSGRKVEVKNWLVAKKSLAVAALWRWPVIRGHLYRKCIWNSKWWPLSGGGRSNWWPVKTSYTVPTKHRFQSSLRHTSHSVTWELIYGKKFKRAVSVKSFPGGCTSGKMVTKIAFVLEQRKELRSQKRN